MDKKSIISLVILGISIIAAIYVYVRRVAISPLDIAAECRVSNNIRRIEGRAIVLQDYCLPLYLVFGIHRCHRLNGVALDDNFLRGAYGVCRAIGEVHIYADTL